MKAELIRLGAAVRRTENPFGEASKIEEAFTDPVRNNASASNLSRRSDSAREHQKDSI